MTIKQAYQILKQHAEWRQGSTNMQVDPKDLTKALDIVLTYLNNKIFNHANL
jgi:hypothetical protein